jgi:signal transduction histidine kinase
MRRFRDLPIRQKLTLGNVLASAFALLLATALLVAYELITFRTAMVRQLSGQAVLVGYNSASALVFSDREAAAKTLAALRAEPSVIAAAVYGKDGRPFATYLRAGVRDAPALAEPVAAGGRRHRFGAGELVVSEPITVDDERVGSVRIVSDLRERDARLRRYLGIVAVAFLAAIVGAMLLSARFQRTISGPIRHLVERARSVTEEQNYAVRAIPSGNDELGLLVRTFNEMLTQIQARDTALESARVAAEEASRAKDEFLAVVSHELRTPLTPIISWTRMLRSGTVAQEGTDRALEVIERNARSQAQLVDDLLDVSRIIAGKMRLDVQLVDLGPIVENTADSLRPAAEAKGIRLQVLLDPRAGRVSGDAERLQQVCWNLVANAIKFTPKGGRVQVQLQRVDSQVELTVSDTGQGIPPGFLGHLFERFRQADSSSTRRHGGLGLGLAIVRHIVELHGGQVRAESGGEGHGATFVVSLPVTLLRAAPSERIHPTAPTFPPPAAERNLKGLRVLVVDDEPDTLDTLRAILLRAGAEVLTAADAMEALTNLQSWKPDVLVSDIGMPGDDGYALIRKIRALAPEQGGKTLALALTAYARVEDRLKVLAAGYQLHVPKPIEPAELVALVGSLSEWQH